MRPISILLFSFLALGLIAEMQAHARSKGIVCNSHKPYMGTGTARLNSDVWFAIGFHKGGRWVSSGWWRLALGECRNLDNFPKGELYVSVMEYNRSTKDTYSWPGSFVFCTRDESYQEVPAQNCGNGFTKTDFFKASDGPSDQSRRLVYRKRVISDTTTISTLTFARTQ